MPELEMVSKLPPPPDRPDDAHKGTFGTVIVVGGSPTMMGAPALCAAGALRGGVGLAKIAAPSIVLPVAIAIEPGATGIALGKTIDDDLAGLDAADPQHRAVLAVGPGMGLEPQGLERLRALLGGQRAPAGTAGRIRQRHRSVAMLYDSGEFDTLIMPRRGPGSPAMLPFSPRLSATQYGLKSGEVF